MNNSNVSRSAPHVHLQMQEHTYSVGLSKHNARDMSQRDQEVRLKINIVSTIALFTTNLCSIEMAPRRASHSSGNSGRSYESEQRFADYVKSIEKLDANTSFVGPSNIPQGTGVKPSMSLGMLR